MIKYYVLRIKMKKMTIEEVPEKYREDVRKELYPNEDNGTLTVEFANNKVVEYNLKTDYEKLLYDFKIYFNSNCSKIPGETELDRVAALLDDEFEDI